MISWDEYFIKMAMLVATKSKDPSSKVGCVIVGPDNEIRSSGFNGFPRGVHETHADVVCELMCNGDDEALNALEPAPGDRLLDRWDRPDKYEWVEHAERNALYNAARIGTALEGCTAYLNWEPYPCIDCTNGFIQVGIVEVVGPNIPFSSTSNKDWKFDKSAIALGESGVKTRTVKWDVAGEN